MIACVTVEVAMVVSPAVFYQPDEIHLFRYTRAPWTPKARFYGDHFNEVVRQLKEKLPECIIKEHTEEPVYDFRRMSGSLDKFYALCTNEHPDCEILANLSSGSHEFAAALGIFSYIHPCVTLFKASTKEYAVTQERWHEFYYADGKPVGLSRKMHPPREIAGVRLEIPDEKRVRALKIYQGLLDDGVEPYWSRMVPLLKEQGLWDAWEGDRDYRCSQKTRDKMAFLRHYRYYWEDSGWVYNDGHKCPRLTETGREVTEMFWVGDAEEKTEGEEGE